MPRRDRTGPMGMGSMIGRKPGFCAGFGIPSTANSSPGRGFGGGGQRCRQRFYATGLPGWMRFGGYAAPPQQSGSEMEKRVLENQAGTLQSELHAIEKRLSEIETGNTGQ